MWISFWRVALAAPESRTAVAFPTPSLSVFTVPATQSAAAALARTMSRGAPRCSPVKIVLMMWADSSEVRIERAAEVL